MDKFHGTICLITGASTGIGKYLATQFVKTQQLHVIGLSRRKIEDITEENFTSLQCDLSKPHDIKTAFEQVRNAFPNKRISILVNNAGLSKAIPLIHHEKLRKTGVPEN